MSYPSPPQLSSAGTRIDSGDTVESPFSSNLVTPADEDPYFIQGIHERLNSTKAAGEYFDSTIHDDSAEQYEVAESEHVSKVILSSTQTTAVHATPLEIEPTTELAKETPSLGSFNGLSASPSSFSSVDSLLRARNESIYNLPNDHIFIEGPSTHLAVQAKHRADTAASRQQNYDWELEPLYSLTGAVYDSLLDSLGLLLRILFFLPWSVAVGGCLILFPDYLDLLAFGTGYLEPVDPIRRFSHWAAYGFHHLTIFFAFLGALIWNYPDAGFAIVGGFSGQLYLSWHDFAFDSSIPLGQDVRHVTYLLFTTSWLDSDCTLNVRKIDGGYYWAGDFINGNRESNVDLD